MREPTLDIFFGKPDRPPIVWMEAVEGLGAAEARMKQLAEQRPGSYFIYSSQSQGVLGQLETTNKRASVETLRASPSEGV